MKFILYPLIIGLTIGGIFFIAGSFAKTGIRNDQERKQARSTIGAITGLLGFLVGSGWGFKLANEDYGKEMEKRKYLKSLTSKSCAKCSRNFEYSTLKNPIPIICSNCINKCISDVKNLKKVYEKSLKQLSTLKKPEAKIERLNAIIEACKPIIEFEKMGIESCEPTALLIQQDAELEKDKLLR